MPFSFFFPRRAPLALAQFDPLVGGAAGEFFPRPVGPEDLDGLDAVGGAEAEVGARLAATEVALGGVQPAHLAAAAGPQAHLAAQRVAAQGRVEGPHLQPVAAVTG